MFDDFSGGTHLFPAFTNEKVENVIPIADFIAKRLRSLNTSFRTSTDSDERLEIIQGMLVCTASLSLLTLATYHESQQLIDTAKDIYKGIDR